MLLVDSPVTKPSPVEHLSYQEIDIYQPSIFPDLTGYVSVYLSDFMFPVLVVL